MLVSGDALCAIQCEKGKITSSKISGLIVSDESKFRGINVAPPQWEVFLSIVP